MVAKREGDKKTQSLKPDAKPTKREAQSKAQSSKPDAKSRPAKADAQADSPALTHPEIRAIVIGIMLAMFLGALDQTIVATALPTIGRHFGNLAICPGW